ncbi:MAG: hypothetical protein CVT82_14800 [Alphaproteobacteria bacterium HGW-Alphaproteobacteria-4]|nr:MAG: hypothetical protein CVT82_14800 [Alphaproteobacteria bacterium HGW-Alphaproteobacteria-4]
MRGRRLLPTFLRRDVPMLPIDHRRTAFGLLVAFVAALALFRGAPQLDLRVSALFFDASRGGFWLVDLPSVQLWRSVLWNLSTMMMLAAVAGLAWPYLGVSRRVWGFIGALYLLGPGVMANLVLKNNWGRARPAEIAEFGGAARFTPAGATADQCATNCSFVSGEVASATAFTISALLLLWCWRARLAPSVRWLGVGLAVTVTLASAAQRIVAGRHFVSDSVFAVLLVAAVALALSWVFAQRTAPKGTC